MATILLDSCVIFDLLNGRRKRREYLNQVLEEGNLLACCPVNITEVYAGVREHELTVTRLFLESLEFLPVTAAIAEAAGLLRRHWSRRGRTLSFMDVTIAAVAIHHRAPLLTDNVKDFPMSGLELYPLPRA